jgi:hypothetical protein
MNSTTITYLAVAMIVPYLPVISTTARVTSSYVRAVPKDAVYLKDDSDWWSPTRREGADEPTAEDEQLFEALRDKIPVERDLGKFPILGVHLASHEGDDWLRHIEAGLGKTKIVERGDGATGRSQLCYRSSGPGNINLIFEHNETFYSYYLFDDGHSWKGKEYCAQSPKVTPTLATLGGLKLGMTKAESEAILGKATYERQSTRWYSYEAHRFVTIVPDNPADWVISGTLELRFSNNRLTYLALSRSEVS